jgi:hypothetical protein
MDAVARKDYPIAALLIKLGAHDLANKPCMKIAKDNDDQGIMRLLQLAAIKQFNYIKAMNDPEAKRPSVLRPMKKGYITMNTTGVIEAIEGRKVTINLGSNKSDVFRLQSGSVFKKEKSKEQQTRAEMYELATLSDFQKGAQVTIETNIGSNIVLEMRKGLMRFNSFELQTK